MNNKKRPTLEELSLYYDGLLEGEAKRRVEEYLQEDASHRLPLELFETIDDALCPSYTEEEVDDFLQDTIKNVHEKIYEMPQRRQAWSWSFLFTPTFIVSALSLFLLVSVISLQVDFSSNRPEINQDMPTERENMILSQADQQQFDFIKSTASRVWDQGVQLASNQSKQLQESINRLPKDNNMELTMDVIQSAIAHTSPKENAIKDRESLSSLANLGKRLLALGLSASLMTLMSIF